MSPCSCYDGEVQVCPNLSCRYLIGRSFLPYRPGLVIPAFHIWCSLTAYLHSEIMSGAESQGQVNTELRDGAVSQPVDASSLVQSETHGEHEAGNVEETPAEGTVSAAEKDGDSDAKDAKLPQSDVTPILNSENTTSAPVDEDKKESSDTTGPVKPKLGMSVNTAGSKPAGPPTPLVKKVCFARWLLLFY